jgi:hypothetical protein
LDVIPINHGGDRCATLLLLTWIHI